MGAANFWAGVNAALARVQPPAPKPATHIAPSKPTTSSNRRVCGMPTLTSPTLCVTEQTLGSAVFNQGWGSMDCTPSCSDHNSQHFVAFYKKVNPCQGMSKLGCGLTQAAVSLLMPIPELGAGSYSARP